MTQLEDCVLWRVVCYKGFFVYVDTAKWEKGSITCRLLLPVLFHCLLEWRYGGWGGVISRRELKRKARADSFLIVFYCMTCWCIFITEPLAGITHASGKLKLIVDFSIMQILHTIYAWIQAPICMESPFILSSFLLDSFAIKLNPFLMMLYPLATLLLWITQLTFF